MTHSTAINSTITKETEATNVSPFEQSGSNKNEMGKKRSFGKKRAVVKVSKDIYQMVTDRVIAALENGVKPWVCPWDKTNECSMLPMNFKTKTNYSGINILLLWSETVDTWGGIPLNLLKVIRCLKTSQRTVISTLYTALGCK